MHNTRKIKTMNLKINIEIWSEWDSLHLKNFEIWITSSFFLSVKRFQVSIIFFYPKCSIFFSTIYHLLSPVLFPLEIRTLEYQWSWHFLPCPTMDPGPHKCFSSHPSQISDSPETIPSNFAKIYMSNAHWYKMFNFH